MTGRLARGALLALVVISLVSIPTLALRDDTPRIDAPAGTDPTFPGHHPGKPVGDHGAGSESEPPGEEAHGEGHADRHAEGKGEGHANRHGDGHRNGHGEGHREGHAEGDGRGPSWATAGDGPPFGLASGYWVHHGGADACERIAARMETHPGEHPPADIRQKLTDKLGCNLAE